MSEPSFRQRALFGGLATGVGQASKILLRLVATVVLARLIAPDEFGLFTLAAAVLAAAMLVREWGVTNLVLQAREIDAETAGALRSTVLVASLVAGLAMGASGWLLAWMMSDPRFVELAWLLAIAAFVGGLATPHLALLRRELRLGRAVLIEAVAQAIGVGVAIAFAAFGAGYRALAAQAVASAFALAIGARAARPWNATLAWRGRAFGAAVAEGARIAGSQSLWYLSRNLDNFLIGARWGAESLGQYGRAYALFLVPLYEISVPSYTIAVPVLARLAGRPTEFRAYFCRMLELVSAITLPLAVASILLADEVSLLALGPRWTEAPALLRNLGPAGILQVLLGSSGWLYAALGRNRAALRWAIASAVALCGGIAIGLPWGALGVARALSIAYLLISIPGLRMAFEGTPIRFFDFLGALRWPAAACLLASATLLLPSPGGGALVAALVSVGSFLTLAFAVAAYRLLRLGLTATPE